MLQCSITETCLPANASCVTMLVTDLRAVKAEQQQVASHSGLPRVYPQRPTESIHNVHVQTTRKELPAFRLAQLQSLLMGD